MEFWYLFLFLCSRKKMSGFLGIRCISSHTLGVTVLIRMEVGRWVGESGCRNDKEKRGIKYGGDLLGSQRDRPL